MSDNYKNFADYIIGEDRSELAMVKAERDYALFSLEREIAVGASDREAAKAEIERLTKQLVKARAALQPFAALADMASDKHRDNRPICYGFNTDTLEEVTIGHLRAAKAALPDETNK